MLKHSQFRIYNGKTLAGNITSMTYGMCIYYLFSHCQFLETSFIIYTMSLVYLGGCKFLCSAASWKDHRFFYLSPIPALVKLMLGRKIFSPSPLGSGRRNQQITLIKDRLTGYKIKKYKICVNIYMHRNSQKRCKTQ